MQKKKKILRDVGGFEPDLMDIKNDLNITLTSTVNLLLKAAIRLYQNDKAAFMDILKT